MLKNFFMSFLGSMAAIWLSVMILFVLTIVFVAGLIGSSLKSVKIADHSILHIQLDGVISEHRTPQDIPDLILNGQSEASTFEDILRSLEYAATDGRIDGVYIDCTGSTLGYASRAELREALARFKKSTDKWILAYGDEFSQGDYYVASAADTVYLNPMGTLDIHGLSSSVPYFKDALDKLDVNIQVFKVGTYKSAVEPFLLNSMSEPARMQTQLFLDSIWAGISEGIGMSRKIPTADVCALADSLTMSRSAQWCLNHKLIDKIAYRRQAEDVLCALTETEEPKDLELVSPAEYMSDYATANLATADDTHIAVVFADGDITENGDKGIVASSLVPEILSLAKDDKIVGMVLRVNSGGGSAFASEQIWDAVRHFKAQNKPVYVSMGDYAASGGYYISCGADRIYAMPQTLTGSIGIFGIVPSIEGTLDKHLGIHFSSVSTSPDAIDISVIKDMTPRQKAEMQRAIQRGYETFVGRVAEGRHISKDSVNTIAQGRVWDGNTALRIGLVDRIGSLHNAIADLARQIGIAPTAYATYPAMEISPLQQLLSAGIAGKDAIPEALKAKAAWAAIPPAEADKALRMLGQIVNMSPIQARMESITLQ